MLHIDDTLREETLSLHVCANQLNPQLASSLRGGGGIFSPQGEYVEIRLTGVRYFSADLSAGDFSPYEFHYQKPNLPHVNLWMRIDDEYHVDLQNGTQVYAKQSTDGAYTLYTLP